MKFTKMHGAGNDYVYVDCFNHETPPDPAAVSIAISDRHKGIGADGLILIRPSGVADARMQMFNADGSEAEMCGTEFAASQSTFTTTTSAAKIPSRSKRAPARFPLTWLPKTGKSNKPKSIWANRF